MKNKTLTIALFALVGVLIGAILLYRKLSSDFAPQQLATISTTASTEIPEEVISENANGATETYSVESGDPLGTDGSHGTHTTDAPAESGTEPTVAELPLAPDFTVYDLEGNSYRLSDFRGKPVVLNFWASWCGPCKQEMPDFNTTYGELGDNIHFLMVNLADGYQETVESASSFIAGTGYTFPVYYDTGSEAAIAYGVYSIPTTYFIDADGYAIAQATGAISADTLYQGIGMIYELGE